MFDDSILEPIRKAIWEAKRDDKKVLKIHVTYDFYVQVRAKCTPPVPDIQKPFEYPIFGYSVVEHVEPCEKKWWLEIEGEPMPQPVSEAWRSYLEYREKRRTQHAPDAGNGAAQFENFD